MWNFFPAELLTLVVDVSISRPAAVTVGERVLFLDATDVGLSVGLLFITQNDPTYLSKNQNVHSSLSIPLHFRP